MEPLVDAQLKALSARIAAARRAVAAQDERLAALRDCARELGSLAAQSKVRPAAQARQRFVLPAVEEEERLRTRADVSFYPDTTPGAPPRWLRWAPHAALAAAGLAFGVNAPWERLAARDRSEPFTPSFALQQAAVAQKAEPLEPVDEETVDRVLQLVYDHRPTRSRETVIEMLGPEIDSSTTNAPWLVERADRPSSYHATLRPYGEALDEAPVYEFAVDLAAGIVRALPSTQAALNGASVAASGR